MPCKNLTNQSRVLMQDHQAVNLFKRYPGNPILTAASLPYPANTVFNCGAIRLATGETLLLLRVEDRRGISHFTVACSSTGFDNWQIASQPTLLPDESSGSDEVWGIEDPRIVYLSERQQYAITYTGYSENGPHVKLALTEDFKTFEKLGSVLPPENKNASLFPRRFKGRWAMLHRLVNPFTGRADIWLSYSPDLRHWGSHRQVLQARNGPWWDAKRIGLATPPIETPEGWLILYHGVRITPSGCLYRLGAALFDLEDPARLIRRGNEWIFGPSEPYEREGDVQDIVFPCGYTLQEDGDTLYLYYGAADTCIALATGSLREILEWLHTQK